MTLAIGQSSKRWDRRAFTLIELILVLALLVIITSLVAPAMSGFIRGRALDSEAHRLQALLHAAQSRAVSEGMPMLVWIDEKTGAYGLEAETSGQSGDAKAENLTVHATLQIMVKSSTTAGITLRTMPAIRLLADGTIDEKSPPALQLKDSAGVSLWLVAARTRTGYEIKNTDK